MKYVSFVGCLQESRDAQSCTMDQLLAIQIDRDQQIRALQEMSRVVVIWSVILTLNFSVA